MKPHQINSGYSFDRFAWAIALLSLALGGALVFGVLHIANKAYHRLQLSKVERAMVERRIADARIELNKLFSGPPVIRYIKPRRLSPEQQELAADLFEASASIQIEDFSAAKTTLQVAAESAREQSSLPERLITGLEQLETDISSLANRRSSLESARDKRERLFQKRVTALSQAETLIRDTATLFSLPTPAGSKSNTNIDFYNEGILRGLPSLSGLPDGIPSLSELSERVNSIGGTLRLGDDSVQALVRARIASLQEGGLSIQGSIEFLDAELAKLPASLDADLNTIASDLSELSERLQDHLLEISAGSGR